MRQIHNDTIDDISLTGVFDHPPVIRFRTAKTSCPKCKVKLKVHYTDTRKIYSLHIGAFSAHRTFMYCPVCKKVHPPEELEEMVPPYSNVGYDVIVFIGRLIFQQHHTIKETIAVLESRNIHVSSSEVAYLQTSSFYRFIFGHGMGHSPHRIAVTSRWAVLFSGC